MLYMVENAYNLLMAGFTTVQSVGEGRDKDLRDAIARASSSGGVSSCQSRNECALSAGTNS